MTDRFRVHFFMVRQRTLPCTIEVKPMNDARNFLVGKSGSELSAIARAAGTSLCHLRNICYGQKRAGPELAGRIERATAGALPRYRLRPDLWNPPSAGARTRRRDLPHPIVKPHRPRLAGADPEPARTRRRRHRRAATGGDRGRPSRDGAPRRRAGRGGFGQRRMEKTRGAPPSTPAPGTVSGHRTRKRGAFGAAAGRSRGTPGKKTCPASRSSPPLRPCRPAGGTPPRPPTTGTRAGNGLVGLAAMTR